MESFCRRGRRFILDGAHNPISAGALVRSLKTQGIRDPWLVFGAMNDKNSRGMLKILSGSFSKVILTGIGENRAKSIGILAEESKGLFKCVLTAQNIEEALGLLRKIPLKNKNVVVTGSFYLVGEARRILNHV
jgi:dihydrofolate synthase/folylpolyglutamate synthase